MHVSGCGDRELKKKHFGKREYSLIVVDSAYLCHGTVPENPRIPGSSSLASICLNILHTRTFAMAF